MNRISSIAVVATCVLGVFTTDLFAGPRPKGPATLTGGHRSPNLVSPGSTREFTYTYPTFTQVVFNPAGGGINTVAKDLTSGLPSGTYSSFDISLDWGNAVNDAYSQEAYAALANSPNIYNPSTIVYADLGFSFYSEYDPDPRPISWDGYMDINYTVGDGPLYFVMAQTFDGSGATWSNVSITLGDGVQPPVTPPVSIASELGGSTTLNLAPRGLQWYSFTYSGTGAFSFDTKGSDLTINNYGTVDDTEIALYSSTGALIAENDDENFDADILTSKLDFASGELPAGTYYLAVGALETVFADGFGAKSKSSSVGTVVINGLTVVPEPAALTSILALACAYRRRR